MSLNGGIDLFRACRLLKLAAPVLASAFLIGCGGDHEGASSPEARAPEVPAPELVSSSPQAGQAWRVDEALSFVTSTPMDCASLEQGGFVLTGQDGSIIPGQLVCAGNRVSFTPDVALTAPSSYTAQLTIRATSQAGQALVTSQSWSFSTEAQWRGAVLVEHDDSGFVPAASPRLMADDQSAAMVVWDQAIGYVSRLHAARYTSAAGWGTPTALDPTGDASGVDLAGAPAGQAVAVWSKFGPLGLDIWADRYSPGQGWGAPVLVEVAGTGGAQFPKVAMDGHGNAIVVWQQGDGSRLNAWTSRLDVETGWSTPMLLEQYDGDASGPQISANAQGRAMAIWTQSDRNTGVAEVWGRLYQPGSGWGSAERVSLAGEVVEEAVMAVDAAGSAVVAWTQTGGAGRGIWSKRFEGGTWSSVLQISSVEGWLPGSLQLALNRDGSGVFSWRELTTKTIAPPFCLVMTSVGGGDCPPTTLSVWDLKIRTYTPASGWGVPHTVDSSDAGDVSNYRLSFDSSGRAYAVWVQSDGSRPAIWFGREQADGSWPLQQQVSRPGLGDAMAPDAIALADGSILVVWAESDGIRASIWSNRLY